ncbi:MAG: hypothetical protein HZB40_05560 [Rhodocyclales bacterium]|nr:hypothetical protein [Rhodocyclales bacterium]
MPAKIASKSRCGALNISFKIAAWTQSRYPITCETDGKTHKGTYWVAGKILTVSTGLGGKSKQVGTIGPEALAKQLLLELVKAGKA